MKQYMVGYGEGRVKMQFADLAGRRHLVLKNKYDMHVTGHSSTQFNLALHDPFCVNLLNTAQHHSLSCQTLQ